jgi:hypothetical protein
VVDWIQVNYTNSLTPGSRALVCDGLVLGFHSDLVTCTTQFVLADARFRFSVKVVGYPQWFPANFTLLSPTYPIVTDVWGCDPSNVTQTPPNAIIKGCPIDSSGGSIGRS